MLETLVKLAKEVPLLFHSFVSFPEKITLPSLKICFKEALNTGLKGQQFITLATEAGWTWKGHENLSKDK